LKRSKKSKLLAILCVLTVFVQTFTFFPLSVAAADPVTVQFNYNYTGAPAAPESFTKTTDDTGKLASFPIEQTLPSVGSRADWGFIGWYTNPEGTGEKVTLDTVFTENTQLYAKWAQVPSMWREYEDYFLMGAFSDYSTTSTQMQKHYNINCPSNNFKLNSQINTTTMRNNFVAARTRILADTTMTAAEKAEALARANEEVVLATSPAVITMLNNIRAWNNSHPESEKKFTRFHVIAWHGGQQPNQFFTNGFSYSNDANAVNFEQDLTNSAMDGAAATRETMKARLDNYIKAVMERYAPYKDIIVSWDVINEPVDDFTGQIRNAYVPAASLNHPEAAYLGDSSSQRGQWGLVWHDAHPARNPDGTRKYTVTADALGVIHDPERLHDESEWMRAAFASAAKWASYYGCDWPLWVNDYMDSNKPYTKLRPTLDILKSIRDEVDLKGHKLVYGLQGRLAWAYPTVEILRNQMDDALDIVDLIGVSEADIRSDFEPNPYYNPTLMARPVRSDDINQWTPNDLNSNSGNYAQRSTLTNTFDTYNGTTRRMPEWGSGTFNSGAMTARVTMNRVNNTWDGRSYNLVVNNDYIPVSECIMKLQADFASDWMDLLLERGDRVELYQWDGTTDSSTFNSSKGAHMWVSNVPGRTGTFEKYSFFAVIGAPNRDKLRRALAAGPTLKDAKYYLPDPAAFTSYLNMKAKVEPLVKKRIYTLEGVYDVKQALADLKAAEEALVKNPPVTIQFSYNYSGAPAAPASFTKQTEPGGLLASFPVEQTLPSGGSRADWGFVGWYTNAAGTGEKVTLDTVFTEPTNLYAKWEQVPSLWKEYEDYFILGAFSDYSTSSTQMQKHYRINCPGNNFKLDSQLDNTSAMRNNFVAARNRILADTTLTEAQKDEALARANEQIVLRASPAVITMLNNIRAWNNSHPESEKKFTRFHVIAWHGGQQPNWFFTNGFSYTNDANAVNLAQNLRLSTQDGAAASRETMKARLDNYIKAVMERYAPYKDIIVSWDVINEPIDDFTGQIRNAYVPAATLNHPEAAFLGDSSSQRGQWGLVWHDKNPARNLDGSRKYTVKADQLGVIYDSERLYDESEWMRWAYESAAKWATYYGCDWPLWVNDYMDSNKPYTKLRPTLDVLKDIGTDIDLKGQKLVYGLQGRLAWAYPTKEILRKQMDDALDVVDLIGVSEADIRSDFEPNPYYSPTQMARPVRSDDINQWTPNVLTSNSGNYAQRSTQTNTFDTYNGTTRRMPEWGSGTFNSGAMTTRVTMNRVNTAWDGRTYHLVVNNDYIPVSECIMKLQADFAADWMDLLVERANRVELYQFDGTTDSSTFNSNKGAHMWVSNVPGRTGTFEKYSFFAVLGSPARDKLKTAINAFPPSYWEANAEAYKEAQDLLKKKIYTLEGVNDVKALTASLTAQLAALDKAYITYDANGGAGPVTTEEYDPGAAATAKSAAAVGISKAGYALTEWNTKANGVGKAYAPGAAITLDTSVRLYAIWEKAPDSYTVKFESYLNDAAGATLNNPDILDVSVPIGGKVPKPADPVKAGSIFEGWFRDMACTNAWDFENGIVTQDMRLYAKWAAYRFSYPGVRAAGLVPGNALSVTLDVGVADATPQKMIVALYDANNRLISVSNNDGVIANGRIKFDVSLPIPANLPSGAYIKVFDWDAETLAPIRNVVFFSNEGVY